MFHIKLTVLVALAWLMMPGILVNIIFLNVYSPETKVDTVETFTYSASDLIEKQRRAIAFSTVLGCGLSLSSGQRNRRANYCLSLAWS